MVSSSVIEKKKHGGRSKVPEGDRSSTGTAANYYMNEVISYLFVIMPLFVFVHPSNLSDLLPYHLNDGPRKHLGRCFNAGPFDINR